jgi:glycosyltransferase involved in cell wall biosynthesis
MGATEREPAIWVDVEDIFDYFRFNPHPSGIQRVAIQIMRALVAEAGPIPVRFVRHGGPDAALREVRWADVEAMLATPPAPEQAARAAEPNDEERRSRIQQAIQRLPPELRHPLFRAGVLQSQVGRNVRQLLETVRPPPARELRAVPTGGGVRDGAGPDAGDLYLVLGAPWSVPGSADLLATLKQRGVRTALLIHDLIPVRRPEWQPPARVERFRSWLEASLPRCDLLLTISGFTARDVEAYAQERGIALSGKVRPIPAGTSCPEPGPVRPSGLPIPGQYVLFVSTLEARKNHPLAFKIWHKLMDEVRAGTRPASSVPQLVFAGRIGLGVADLLQQLDNSRWLGGRIRLIRDPTDPEVRALYEGCLFTLLPSLFEGWGLPIGESLALGKPCLAASGTALPEAGGELCRYFDPEDVGSAYRAVAAVLDQPGAIAAWQAEVRRTFRPRSWQDAAQAILSELAPVPQTGMPAWGMPA